MGVSPDTIAVRLAPEHTSTLDVGLRASAVALGVAVFNAKVAAAAQQVLGPVSLHTDVSGVLLQATLHLPDGHDPDLAALYEPMLARETNRRAGTPRAIPADTVLGSTRLATRSNVDMDRTTGNHGEVQRKRKFVIERADFDAADERR